MRFLLVPLICVLVSGCGNRGPRPLSEDERSKAEAVLRSALDAWKNGESYKKWSAKDSPVIVTVDDDWRNGLRLLDYKITKAERVEGQDAVFWAVLSLRDRNGRTIEKQATYAASAVSPPSIARDPFF